MKKLLLIAFLFSSVHSDAQVRRGKKSITKANEQSEALLLLIGQDGIYSGLTALKSKYSSVYSIPAKDYAALFLDSVNNITLNNRDKFYKTNSKAIYNYLNNIISFGETSPNLYIQKGRFPFSFDDEDGKLTFIQSGIFSKYSLNTLQLNADQRASHIAKAILLPSLANFKPLLDIKEIKYFVIDVGYMAKDFSDENSGDGELTSIVISRGLLIKYINAEITDRDVFNGAIFYNINKNTASSVRKILIN